MNKFYIYFLLFWNSLLSNRKYLSLLENIINIKLKDISFIFLVFTFYITVFIPTISSFHNCKIFTYINHISMKHIVFEVSNLINNYSNCLIEDTKSISFAVWCHSSFVNCTIIIDSSNNSRWSTFNICLANETKIREFPVGKIIRKICRLEESTTE